MIEIAGRQTDSVTWMKGMCLASTPICEIFMGFSG